MPQAPTQIVWFKRDLRTADHAALSRAAACGPVIPLFIVEPGLWREKDMSARQWAFVAECLAELRTALRALGQPLVVRMGDAADVLESLRTGHGAAALWSHQETGNLWTYQRDRRVGRWARSHNIPWHEFPQCGVTRRLADRNGWSKRWDSFMAQAPEPPPKALAPISDLEPGRIPSIQDLRLQADPCPERQRGGRSQALLCLESFLQRRAEIYRRAMSSPNVAPDHCSRLSPHLAWGTISMREVTGHTAKHQIGLRAHDGSQSLQKSLTSFRSRLTWRGHFMQKLEDAPDIETRHFHSAFDGVRPLAPAEATFTAWAKGETGLPFVDACMRALIATGWMNFRMRAMLVAFSSYHLWQHWRQPGEHLARLFTDYEPGIHWSQMQMQSGTTGINTIRIYNPVKQGLDQDPRGTFVRRWVPELRDVPTPFIHEPWKSEGAGTFLDRAYPMPIVDHAAAAKEARQKIWALRGTEGFKAQADRVQNKHGSRKSGLRQIRRPRKKEPDQQQLSLALDPPGT